uniref:Uncharacterized protein n=1 Tax=Lotharella oceanica TaxID=641309 RepID=A0A7S2XB15_9EUKA|mmetsp:Transcript_24947/g.46622  ORF Transcript_24947/g.46622 Transcript_24947/m.46622 type:complete len:315 (+) Transcript_24947:48-992(+)
MRVAFLCIAALYCAGCSPTPRIRTRVALRPGTGTTRPLTAATSSRTRSDLVTNAEREVSNRARLRQEVANPFAVVRLWGSGALSVQAIVASLVATTRLTASLAHAPGADSVAQSAQTLGIDLACFAVLGAIFLREKEQEGKRLQKFEREEALSQLVIELPNGRRTQLQDIQGFARIVIVSSEGEPMRDALAVAEEWKPELTERGVVVVPVDSNSGKQGAESPVDWMSWRETTTAGGAKPFYVKPVRIEEWIQWLTEQKEDANVNPEASVWISLRKDGRVRSSGKGTPPWAKIAKTLPVDKGAWGGFLDGMDGRV